MMMVFSTGSRCRKGDTACQNAAGSVVTRTSMSARVRLGSWPVAQIYTAIMSTTRLLLFGLVRIFQPAYGYQLRRELMTWNVQAWANINPGSIYTGLRTLAKHGYLLELEQDGANRPGRTSYKLTTDGETEYFSLLRGMLWTVDGFHPDKMQAPLAFMWSLRRDEVVDALEARIVQLEQQQKAEPF